MTTLRPRCLRQLLLTAGAFIIIWSELASGVASAATVTWTGAGANNSWANAANWGGVGPVTGDDLVFPANAATLSTVNDLPATTVFASIQFFDNYTVAGTAAGGSLSIGASNVTAFINVDDGHAVTISCPSVILAGNTSAKFTVNLGGSLTIHSTITGVVGFTKNGLGTLTLEGQAPNSFTGRVFHTEGVMVLHQSNGPPPPAGALAIPDGLTIGINEGAPDSVVLLMNGFDQVAGDVTVFADGLWDFNNFFSNDTTGSLSISSGHIHIGPGTLTLGGNVQVLDGSNHAVITGTLSLGGSRRTFAFGSGVAPELDIQGKVLGTATATGFDKTGPGVLRLAGSDLFSGPVTIQQGAVIVAHPDALGSIDSPTVVQGKATLHLETGELIREPLVLDTDGSHPAIVCDGSGVRSVKPGALEIALQAGAQHVEASPGCTLRLSNVAGPGDLIVDDHGNGVELLFGEAHTGNTIVAAGTLRPVGSSGAVSRFGTSDVILQGTTFDLQNVAAAELVKSLRGTGQVLIGTKELTVLMPDAGEAAFDGVVSGSGSVVKLGLGHWTLNGANTFTGDTLVQAGLLAVDGSLTGPVVLSQSQGEGAGTLTGTGSVGPISGSAGRLQPGHAHLPGRLVSQSIDVGDGVAFGVVIAGSTPGSGYSQLMVHGTVHLGNAHLTLEAPLGVLPAGTGDLILIDNDGTDPVTGTFAGLAEGGVVSAPNGATFRISYVGGDGNDVTLSPRGAEYLLSEGSTGAFFDTDILIANPNAVAAPITIRFLREDGTMVTQDRTLPATSRTTIRVDDVAGMEATAFSTIVTSHTGLPLVVERTMQWDSSGYGGHTERAVPGAAQTWYFAEGSQGFFSTFLLLVNPDATPNTATVRYLIEAAPPVVRTYPLPPASRVTLYLGDDPALRTRAFGMIVTFDTPGVAERAMYFGTNPLWKGGHESAGVNAPANTWYVAEGATGGYFTTFILLANPNDTEAPATLTFLPDGGQPVTTARTVPAHGRVTVNIAQEAPSLANTVAVATMVTASGPPILVERAQYWPSTPDQWQEAHNSFGVTTLGTKWGLAEGRVGGPQAYQTFILLANPNTAPATVAIQFLREDGTTIAKSVTVAPTSRLNVTVGPGTSVPELIDERFGAVVTSDQPIAVERSVYWNANGIVWAAGTSATATPLP